MTRNVLVPRWMTDGCSLLPRQGATAEAGRGRWSKPDDHAIQSIRSCLDDRSERLAYAGGVGVGLAHEAVAAGGQGRLAAREGMAGKSGAPKGLRTGLTQGKRWYADGDADFVPGNPAASPQLMRHSCGRLLT